MQTLVYDGSFPGLLTAIFETYEYRLTDPVVVPESRPAQSLFGETRIVHTAEEKANRVWSGLQQRISLAATRQIYRAFLSEEREMEKFLLLYAQYVFKNKLSIEYDFSHPAVRYIIDTARKVHRERHRMEAFVRFQQTKDNLYYAVVSPDFNVLPLIQEHFQRRYADQRWVIYDTQRRYGIFYDGHATATVQIDFNEELASGNAITSILDEEEDLFKRLWQHYFDSVNIKARRNMRLHIRHMPRRYWKYLPEKQPDILRPLPSQPFSHQPPIH